MTGTNARTPALIAAQVTGSTDNTSEYRAAFEAAAVAQTEPVTMSQYEAICAVIDRAKNDDESLDTDEYAGAILEALGATQ